jgi:hypothetical protein
VATTGFGRGAAQLTYKVPPQAQVMGTYSFFFVSSSDIFFIDVDTDTITNSSHPRLAGEMLAQSPSTKLDNTALNGASVASGSGFATNSSVFAGILTADGTGNASISYDENNGGAISTPSFLNGTYAVNSNGRVSFSNLGINNVSRVAVVYLTDLNRGFLIGSDIAVTSGVLENQTLLAPFSAASFQGNVTIGNAPPASNQERSYTGQVLGNGDGTLSGTTNNVPPTGNSQIGQLLTATYSINPTTGRGVMSTNSGGGLFPVNVAFYVVNAGSFRLIPLDTNFTNPGVILFDH